MRWDIRSNTAPLIQGVQQYQSLSFVHSATRPDHLTSRVIVRPRLDSFSGATSIYLTAELTPVVVDGRVVYRLAGKSSRAFSAVVAIRGDIAGDMVWKVEQATNYGGTKSSEPGRTIKNTGADAQPWIVD